MCEGICGVYVGSCTCVVLCGVVYVPKVYVCVKVCGIAYVHVKTHVAYVFECVLVSMPMFQGCLSRAGELTVSEVP